MLIRHIRDQWLSILVMVNYWKRRHHLSPDEWYWADLELMNRGRYWMPCYWSVFRFHGLLSTINSHLRIAYLRVKIRLMRWDILG